MLGNFSYCNPTKLYFGKKSLNYLNDELSKYGKNVVLIYGGGSIKKNGIYDAVTALLKKNNKTVAEISGVMPNPTVAKLHEGIEIARAHKADLLLAVGGDKKAEVTIAAESNTPGDWNSYLTSPVCDDISQLAYYEKDGKITLGIPVMYFDGISQVSVCKFYSYADGKLSELGNITLYDEKYTTLYCDIIGGD